ncbi:MAG: chain length determinant protein EpsF [Aquabacterium sp.]|nr:chain length determinant protein EpsF [Aquabacterium sp.]
MTFQQIFAILRARWVIALGVFTLVLGGVAAFTFLSSKSYTATASVILDVKNADPILGLVSPSMATPAYLMTQVDVITSKRVAMRVIKNMRLSDSPEMRERWRVATKSTGDFEGWLATLLRSALDVRPSRGSNVIFLTYQAADPHFASTVANAFVQAYLDVVLELRTNPAKQSKDFFDVNARSSRAALEVAQRRLSDYQQNQGLLVTDERLDIETGRLNELSNQVVLTQAAAVDSGSRQAAANNRGDTSPDVMASGLVSSLKGDLIRQQTTLEQLATRFGGEHPQVLEIKSGIAESQRKLDAEIRRVTSSVGVGNSVNLSRVAQLRASLDDQRNKVMKMKVIRDEAAILVRDVDNAQRAYDGVLLRMNNTNLESQANQANVSALEYAVAPSTPSSPRIFTNLALGGLVASLLALAMALLIEHLDRRLRVDAEVDLLLNQPLLGSIPSFKKRKPAINVAQRLRIAASPVRTLSHEA